MKQKILEKLQNKEFIEKFVNANTEEQARELLESECGKVSDEDFVEIKKGISVALDKIMLKGVSGGVDEVATSNKSETVTAKDVFKLAAKFVATTGMAGMAIWGGYKIGKSNGFSDGQELGLKSGFSNGVREGHFKVTGEYY